MIRLIGVFLFEWFWCLSDMLLKPRMLSYEKGLKRDIRYKFINDKKYKQWKKHEFLLNSDFGYKLYCELIEPELLENEAAAKVAILCHGFGCARYGCIKYVELFLKLGFTVLLYDHRNHGKSGRAYTSMGYYEKYDLKKMVDWCLQNFGKNCSIVTHGESMGAATVLMHLEIDKRVKVTIADCAYSDLKLLIRHQLKQYYHIPSMLIPLVSFLSYLRAGFWFWQVSPIRAVLKTDTPVLFIHGKRDNLVPAYMSRQMYDCKKKNKGIYLVAKARHAECICMNSKEYEKRVSEFIRRYITN